jgi:hypothetical protein
MALFFTITFLLGNPIPFIPFPLSRGRGRDFKKRGLKPPLKHPLFLESQREALFPLTAEG